MTILDAICEPIKNLFDWSAVGTTIAAVFKMIPEVSALVALIWMCIRVWETDTVKGWRTKNKEK